MKEVKKDTYMMGKFTLISMVVWLLIFGLTVSESLFYYQIHEQPAPIKKILFNDLFILFWIPISPILFKILQWLYSKKTSWLWYGTKAFMIGAAAILVVLFTESSLHYFSEANETALKSYADIFIQLITLRFQTNLILGLGFVSSCVAYLSHSESQSLARKQEELNRNLMTAQLEVLKAQMKPHFLFNSLHAISGLILKQDNDKAISVIAKLSDLLRESIDMDSKKWITIKEEMDFIVRYLEIYQLRFGEQFKCVVEIDENIKNHLIPPALLQPIVENSIVHGIVPNDNKGTVAIKAYKNDHIHIEISDSSFLNRSKAAPLVEGLGLSNTRKRLTSLFDIDFELDFDQEHSRTTIAFPVVETNT